ncbi:MFS transporter [Nocardiopsis sp. L17-MgMaSL7]|uniref:MFS transporter n=1 Tax=Nocardiopsis sp. L17-MgMaSL7 TaxID=1938893 RepID=UPI000D71C086|nr:MFS transporter [Nocardiopsis sp. L17-MgMaSL7]PWV47247.1 putative MFS family arabinose efflux permease [Nocardiopsis sp. L17-MgMaSL7]
MRGPRLPPLWLLPLVLAAFAVQTDDFVIIGVLPAIASAVTVSETAAGQLVTVYSLVYALTAPLWAVLFARVPRRRALLGALAVFAAANVAVPLVNGYPALMALRVIAALAAAVVLPTSLALAGTLAPPERRGRHLAAVMTGLTGAVLLGVPLGTWIGALWGWEATFVFCGFLGLTALVLASRTLPSVVVEEDDRTLTDLVRPLVDRTVAVVLAVTVLTVAGNLAFQTYVAVVLSGLSGVTPVVLGVLLVCSGVGGLLGAQASGYLVDRIGALRTLRCSVVLFALTMSALALLWLARPAPLWAVTPLLVAWSAAAWAVPPSLQTLMLDRAGTHAASQAMAVHSGSVYVGAALGGVLGGAAVAASPGLVPVVAATAAGVGLLLSSAFTRSPDRVVHRR